MNHTEEQEELTTLNPVELDKKEEQILLRRIPQGPGSKLDADTVRGLIASTKASPNALFALNEKGKFSTSVGGGVSGSFTTADSKTVTVVNGIITAIV